MANNEEPPEMVKCDGTLSLYFSRDKKGYEVPSILLKIGLDVYVFDGLFDVETREPYEKPQWPLVQLLLGNIQIGGKDVITVKEGGILSDHLLIGLSTTEEGDVELNTRFTGRIQLNTVLFNMREWPFLLATHVADSDPAEDTHTIYSPEMFYTEICNRVAIVQKQIEYIVQDTFPEAGPESTTAPLGAVNPCSIPEGGGATPLLARFKVINATGFAPLEVTFKNTSLGLEIKSWQWTWGDGKTSKKTAPADEITHVYEHDGRFFPTLMIEGVGLNGAPITSTTPAVIPVVVQSREIGKVTQHSDDIST